MIKVSYDPDELYIRMIGHAGADRNEEGHDLVCASASMLIYTLVESAGRDDAVCRVSYTLESGNAKVRIRPCEPKAYEHCRIKLETILDGMRLLEKRYPNCIELLNIAEMT